MITDSVEDIRRKLSSTYVKYTPEPDEEYILFVNEVETNHVEFYSRNLGEIRVTMDKFRQFTTFHFPDSGLYNIGDSCCEFLRRPERQWRKAPCSENVQVNPITNTIRTHRPLPVAFNTDTFTNLFRPKYPKNLQEAIDTLKESTAINKNFAVSISGYADPNRFLFWYRSNPIGVIDNKDKTIRLNYHLLKQEVEDLLNEREPAWKLKN